MEFPSPKIKKFFILYKKKNFFFFGKKPTPRKFIIFWEMELSGPKIKNFLLFSQKKLFLYFLIFSYILASSLKKIQEGTLKFFLYFGK